MTDRPNLFGVQMRWPLLAFDVLLALAILYYAFAPLDATRSRSSSSMPLAKDLPAVRTSEGSDRLWSEHGARKLHARDSAAAGSDTAGG